MAKKLFQTLLIAAMLTPSVIHKAEADDDNCYCANLTIIRDTFGAIKAAAKEGGKNGEVLTDSRFTSSCMACRIGCYTHSKKWTGFAYKKCHGDAYKPQRCQGC